MSDVLLLRPAKPSRHLSLVTSEPQAAFPALEAAPAPAVDRFDALRRAVPDSAEVASGAEPEAIGALGEVKLRIAALESALAARVLARANAPGQELEGLDRLVGVQEAARVLGVSTDYVYTHARELPFVRKGRRLLFRRAALTHPGSDRDTIRARGGQ